MSAEGEAIRSNDYRKDTTVKAPSTRPAAVLGLDVGKSSHWACLIDRDGEVLASAPVRNREAELDALFASAPAGTLVVVDQFRNIGSLAVRRARAAGLGVAYLPGLAASRAAGLFAGEAKTDDVSVNLFFTSFAKQAHRSRKGGFTGCANVFSPIPVTA